MRSARWLSPARSRSPWPFWSGSRLSFSKIKMRGSCPRITSKTISAKTMPTWRASFSLLARRCHLRLDLEELIAGAGDGLFDDVAFDIERRFFIGADHPDRVPRPELRGQLLAAGFARERPQRAVGLRFEDEDAHDGPPLGLKSRRLGRRRLRYRTSRSDELDGADRGLGAARIGLGVELHLLAFAKALDAGALERGGMDEHVLLAVVRLDEAEAFLVVVEFDGAVSHRGSL